MFFFLLYLIYLFVAPVYCGPIKCTLSEDFLNSILNEPYAAKEGFGVEPAVGFVSLDDKLPEHNITQKELEICIKEHFTSTQTNHSQTPAFAGLAYKKPSYLGGKVPDKLPVPEPDDNYLIPEEGYTTYLNPHDFEAKQTEKPDAESPEKTNGVIGHPEVNNDLTTKAPPSKNPSGDWYDIFIDEIADYFHFDDWL